VIYFLVTQTFLSVFHTVSSETKISLLFDGFFSAIFPYKNPYPESSTGQAVAYAMCGFCKKKYRKK